MPTYFFSGINRPALMEMLSRRRACGMVNALSAGQRALLSAYEQYPAVPLVLDSGAYQGYRDVEGYARLIKQIGSRMLWCASLDVLHNQQASNDHYERLIHLLAEEEELARKLLWIYQCQSRGGGWHHEGDLDALRRALQVHKFIGVGGIVSVLARDPIRAMDLLATIGEILDKVEAQAHIFGLGSYALLQFACTQRWFRSADSTRWLQGLSSRLLLTTDGHAISARRLTFTGMAIAEQNIGAMQTWFLRGRMRQLFLFPEEADKVPSLEPTTAAKFM